MLTTRFQLKVIWTTCTLLVVLYIIFPSNRMDSTRRSSPIPEKQSPASPSSPGMMSATPEPTYRASPTPILTLFTTFKPSANRSAIYKTTIRNWARLQPSVRIVVYVSEVDMNQSAPLIAYAVQHGWTVAETPKLNKLNTPFVNSMYVHAETHYKSEFYSYANGDILFEDGIVRTLEAVRILRPNERVLVIGQRVNYVLKNHSAIAVSTVDELRTKQRSLAHSINWGLLQAIDFFITRRHGFPWATMPQMVVGRAGYDSYVIYRALVDNTTVITATKTMTTVHIQAKNWLLSHRTDANKDGNFNVKTIAASLPNGTRLASVWSSGTLRSARFETVLGDTGIAIEPLTSAKRKQMQQNTRAGKTF